MARSPHAFLRGNTAQHYAWLQALDLYLPKGSPIWICGDCHVGNLGPTASTEGAVDIQIRDLDQTVIGYPAYDLIRLALSLTSIARSSNLPGATTALMIEEMLAGYEIGLSTLDRKEALEEPNVVTVVRRRAMGRDWQHLARDEIEDKRPTIPLGKKFRALPGDVKWEIGLLLDSPAVKDLILSIARRSEGAKVELIDAAYWVKGCSSLGNLRVAALISVNGDQKRKLSLVDIKEAVPSVVPPAAAAEMPAHNGERVVAGARALSPNLGDRMAAGDLAGRPVVVRELMPEDLKLDIEQFTRKEAVGAARYLASVVGRAHGRQMHPDDRRSWIAEFTSFQRNGKSAPSWLWQAVVRLHILHEQAYLQHCRDFAIHH